MPPGWPGQGISHSDLFSQNDSSRVRVAKPPRTKNIFLRFLRILWVDVTAVFIKSLCFKNGLGPLGPCQFIGTF